MEASWAAVLVNAVLVLVTAAYVGLTRRLSKDSAAAAASAADSALSAADSARSQRAAIEAEANRRHAWFKTAGGGRSLEEYDIAVRPLVGAYVLHKVVLHEVRFQPRAHVEIEPPTLARIEPNRELQPKEQAMPAIVDEIEGAWFRVDVATIAHEAFPDDEFTVEDWSFDWALEVTFSLSEFSDAQRRVMVYSDPERDPRLTWLKQYREYGFDS